MTPVDLLAELRRRGVVLERHGDRLRYRPADRVTETELAIMRAEKTALLRLLPAEDPGHPFPATDVAALRHSYQDEFDDADRTALQAQAAAGDHLVQWILRAVLTPAGEPAAWRVFSHRLDREAWICADADALADLGDARAGLPVVLADDLERLRTMNDTMLHCVFDALAVFPGARLADVVVKNAD
jgi:hypothetical protein